MPQFIVTLFETSQIPFSSLRMKEKNSEKRPFRCSGEICKVLKILLRDIYDDMCERLQ